MKNFLLSLVYCLISIGIYSCTNLEPVTMGGVENPKLKNISREGIEFDFGMKIKNPNKVRVTVFPSEFDATVNDISIGKIKLTRKVRIKANSDGVSEFSVKSDFSKLGLGDVTKVLSIVTSKSASITVKGDIKAGKWFYKKRFPVDIKKTIPLSK